MSSVIDRTNDNGSMTGNIQRKWAIFFAKLGIASGLIALLVSVTTYGLEEAIYKRIDEYSVVNQKLYRLDTIDDYSYHTQLKYATLQKLSISYIWTSGLTYCASVIPMSIILLIGLTKGVPKIILIWLVLSAIFLLLVSLAICCISMVMILLGLVPIAVLFLLVSLLIVSLYCYFWYTVHCIYKMLTVN